MFHKNIATRSSGLLRRHFQSLVLTAPASINEELTPRPKPFGKYKNHFQKLSKLQKQTQSEKLIEGLLGSEYSIPSREELEIMAPRLRNFPHKRDNYWKLAVLGSDLLTVECNVFTISARSHNSVPINGLYFENMVNSSKSFTSLAVLTTFVREHGLTSALISDHTDRIRDTDRDKHAVDSLFMLIGSVYNHHGTSKARDFLQQRVINGINGLSHVNMKLHSDHYNG